MPNEPVEPIPSVAAIITSALRKAGVAGIDESIEPDMLNEALLDCNDLLAQYQRSRYLIYHLVTYGFPATGAQTYNVGLNQTVNINPRPDRLESAYLRLNGSAPNPVDIPLDIIPSMENYNRIALKNLGTIAWRIFYDPGWPIGTLYPWPVPQQSIYQVFVTFKETLARFQSLQQPVNLPPEYSPALKWGLAEVLRASYQLPPDPMVSKFAQRALNAIRLANVAVPTLTLSSAVTGRTRAYDYRGSDEA